MEHLYNIVQAGHALGLRPANVIELVRTGKLPAFKTIGGPVVRGTITSATRGLRFRPADVEAYRDSTAVR